MGRHVDIIPAHAGKANAILFLCRFFGISQSNVVAAGDSGNDADLFTCGFRGIVVSNAEPALVEAAQKQDPAKVYFSKRSYAAGVEEGLEWFGVL